jgi:hypothetical protein
MTQKQPERGASRLYPYRTDGDRFNSLMLVERDGLSVLDGPLKFIDSPERLASKWRPIAVTEFADGIDGDFPSLVDYDRQPVLSQRAWDVIADLVGRDVEALAIAHPSGRPFYFLHATRTFDCVDLSGSVVRRFKDGRLAEVKKFAIDYLRLPDRSFFKLPDNAGEIWLMDEEFRQVIEKNNLSGLVFEDLPIV